MTTVYGVQRTVYEMVTAIDLPLRFTSCRPNNMYWQEDRLLFFQGPVFTTMPSTRAQRTQAPGGSVFIKITANKLHTIHQGPVFIKTPSLATVHSAKFDSNIILRFAYSILNKLYCYWVLGLLTLSFSFSLYD